MRPVPPPARSRLGPPVAPPATRADAVGLDASDHLSAFRNRLALPPAGTIYLAGNSLGCPPMAAVEQLTASVDLWAMAGVSAWHHWIDLSTDIGDRLAASVLGCGAGEVVLADSTSVNLYKLAGAALAARPDRPVIVTDRGNFPSDRFVLEGLAVQQRRHLRVLQADPTPSAVAAATADGDVALVCLSLVSYASAEVLDLRGVTDAAHRGGALMLWDLSHAAGVLPVELADASVDLAVGCTYKYLHGGPGAPAFLFVRQEHQDQLRQPIWGWFGQRDQFAMGRAYDPAPGIASFLVGTPPILSLVAAEAGIRLVAEAGVEALRAKSIALSDFAAAAHQALLPTEDVTIAGPTAATRRGSHIAFRHADAWRLTQALAAKDVVVDFRAPDLIRFGLAPLSTRFVDVWDAAEHLAAALAERTYEAFDANPARIT